MSTFKIIHREELIGCFYIDAASEDDAIREYERLARNGEIDYSDMEITSSSDEAVLDDK